MISRVFLLGLIKLGILPYFNWKMREFRGKFGMN